MKHDLDALFRLLRGRSLYLKVDVDIGRANIVDESEYNRAIRGSEQSIIEAAVTECGRCGRVLPLSSMFKTGDLVNFCCIECAKGA